MHLSASFSVAIFASVVIAACGEPQSAAPSSASGAADSDDKTRAALATPQYEKHVREKHELMQKEEQVTEQANWFGKTGLSESIERELPRYLRREYGQSIFDEGALKADSLQYLGVYPQGLSSIHFWRIADGAKEPHFAYITVSVTGDTVIGWGGKRPPPK